MCKGIVSKNIIHHFILLSQQVDMYQHFISLYIYHLTGAILKTLLFHSFCIL